MIVNRKEAVARVQGAEDRAKRAAGTATYLRDPGSALNRADYDILLGQLRRLRHLLQVAGVKRVRVSECDDPRGVSLRIRAGRFVARLCADDNPAILAALLASVCGEPRAKAPKWVRVVTGQDQDDKLTARYICDAAPGLYVEDSDAIHAGTGKSAFTCRNHRDAREAALWLASLPVDWTIREEGALMAALRGLGDNVLGAQGEYRRTGKLPRAA